MIFVIFVVGVSERTLILFLHRERGHGGHLLDVAVLTPDPVAVVVYQLYFNRAVCQDVWIVGGRSPTGQLFNIKQLVGLCLLLAIDGSAV